MVGIGQMAVLVGAIVPRRGWDAGASSAICCMGRDPSSICRPVSVSGSATLGRRVGILRVGRVAHRYCLLVFIASLYPPSNRYN